MRNVNYETIVYNNGIYGIKSGLRNRIEQKTIECLNRKRAYSKNRTYTKTELIIKLSLIISILSLVAILCIS